MNILKVTYAFYWWAYVGCAQAFNNVHKAAMNLLILSAAYILSFLGICLWVKCLGHKISGKSNLPFFQSGWAILQPHSNTWESSCSAALPKLIWFNCIACASSFLFSCCVAFYYKYSTIHISILLRKGMWVLSHYGGVWWNFSVALNFISLRIYDVEYPCHILLQAGGMSLKYISIIGFISIPKSIYWSPSSQEFRMWFYLKIELFQIKTH